jgi:hypothetical protein
MKNVEVYVEQVPEHYVSDLSITITCKKSDSHEAQAIIDYLSSIVNVSYRKPYNE